MGVAGTRHSWRAGHQVLLRTVERQGWRDRALQGRIYGRVLERAPDRVQPSICPLFDPDSALKAKLSDQALQDFHGWLQLGQLYEFIGLVRLINGSRAHDQSFKAELL